MRLQTRSGTNAPPTPGWASRGAVLVVITAVLAAACGGAGGDDGGSADHSPGDSGRVTAFVSIPPQRYFVEQLGGDLVETKVLLPPGASPATYDPEPSQLRALSAADVYFAVDVPFERALGDRLRSAGGDMRWVRTWKDVDRRQLPDGKPDPHIWLSPRRVKDQAETMTAALSSIDPAHADTYRANLDKFQTHIDELDADITRKLEPYAGAKFMSFHPAWNYVAADYGLKLIPIESGGKEPSARELQHLIERAKRLNIQVVFVQPQFSTDDARTIANQVGATVARLDPLAPNWAANMRHVSSALADAVQRGPR